MDPYEDHNRKILSPLDKQYEEKKTDDFVKEDEENKEDEGTLVEHLTDLRKQLIKSAFVFLFFFIAVFSTINIWFPYVTRGHELIILGPFQVVKFYMSISLALSLGLSLPFLAHYIWQFVKPGLYPKEAKSLGLYAPLMLILFIMGVGFGYFVVNPLSYDFLISLGAVNFDIMVSAEEYVRFLMMTTMPLGLLFELPVIVMFLASIDVLTAETMKKVRKWSYLAIAIISAVITPPDFISQLLVLIPMIFLYEGSIYVIKIVERRKSKMESTASI